MRGLNESVGVVHPSEMYTLEEFSKRTGMRAASIRSARRAGLRVHYVQKRAFVYGQDWIDYVLKVTDGRGQLASSSV